MKITINRSLILGIGLLMTSLTTQALDVPKFTYDHKKMGCFKAGVQGLNAAPVAPISSSATFECTDMKTFDFSSYSSFIKKNLRGADLTGVTVPVGGSFEKSQLEGAILTGGTFSEVSFAFTLLKNANFRGAKLDSANFTSARGEDVDFSATDAGIRTDLGKANLTSVKFLKSNFTRANLTDAVMTDARLRECNINAARFAGTEAIMNPVKINQLVTAKGIRYQVYLPVGAPKLMKSKYDSATFFPWSIAGYDAASVAAIIHKYRLGEVLITKEDVIPQVILSASSLTPIAGTTFTLSSDAYSPIGDIKKIEILKIGNSTPLKTCIPVPPSPSLTSCSLEYSLTNNAIFTSKAYDDFSPAYTGFSLDVVITPKVVIPPTTNIQLSVAQANANENFTVTANSSSISGNISKIEIYKSGVLLHACLPNPPLASTSTCSIQDKISDTTIFTSIAYDDLLPATIGYSAPVTLTVNTTRPKIACAVHAVVDASFCPGGSSGDCTGVTSINYVCEGCNNSCVTPDVSTKEDFCKDFECDPLTQETFPSAGVCANEC